MSNVRAIIAMAQGVREYRLDPQNEKSVQDARMSSTSRIFNANADVKKDDVVAFAFSIPSNEVIQDQAQTNLMVLKGSVKSMLDGINCRWCSVKASNLSHRKCPYFTIIQRRLQCYSWNSCNIDAGNY